MASYTTERVIEVQHWSDKLFSFRTTRGAALRFDNGQFIMVGLEGGGRKIVRAYSFASANHEEYLEFYSIKVPQGPLTSRLQHIEPGEEVLVSSKPTGTLVLRDVRPGKRLFMLATGTGVAPFLALIKDPEIYQRFEQVILVRGARAVADLAYGDSVIARLRDDAILRELAGEQLIDYPSTTREPFRHHGRITTLIETGRLFEDLSLAPLDTAGDRVMICGNMRMLADTSRLLDSYGFAISPRIGVPGDYVIERAFVEEFQSAPPREDEDSAPWDLHPGNGLRLGDGSDLA
ncbi:MAG: ferredoxin--NADP reductase [Steroidobacteraceae bacterium]|jgi:ferredoxin--NADP+ reductase